MADSELSQTSGMEFLVIVNGYWCLPYFIYLTVIDCTFFCRKFHLRCYIGSEYIPPFNIKKPVVPIDYNFLEYYSDWFLPIYFLQLIAIFIAFLSLLQLLVTIITCKPTMPAFKILPCKFIKSNLWEWLLECASQYITLICFKIKAVFTPSSYNIWASCIIIYVSYFWFHTCMYVCTNLFKCWPKLHEWRNKEAEVVIKLQW